MYEPAAYSVYVKFEDSQTWIHLDQSDLSKASLLRKKVDFTNVFVTTLEGDIRFYGAVYNLLHGYLGSYKNPDVKIVKNGSDYWFGKLDLFGTWNTETKECELPASLNDVLSPFFNQWDESVDRLGGNENKIVSSELICCFEDFQTNHFVKMNFA